MKRVYLFFSFIICQPAYSMLKKSITLKNFNVSCLSRMFMRHHFDIPRIHPDFLNMKFLTSVDPMAQVLNSKSPLAWLIEEEKEIVKEADPEIQPYINFYADQVPVSFLESEISKETADIEGQKNRQDDNNNRDLGEIENALETNRSKLMVAPGKFQVVDQKYYSFSNTEYDAGFFLDSNKFSLFNTKTGRFLYADTYNPDLVLARDTSEANLILQRALTHDYINLKYLITKMGESRTSGQLETLVRLGFFYQIRSEITTAWKQQSIAEHLIHQSGEALQYRLPVKSTSGLDIYMHEINSRLSIVPPALELNPLTRLLIGLKIHDLHQNNVSLLVSEQEWYTEEVTKQKYKYKEDSERR